MQMHVTRFDRSAILIERRQRILDDHSRVIGRAFKCAREVGDAPAIATQKRKLLFLACGRIDFRRHRRRPLGRMHHQTPDGLGHNLGPGRHYFGGHLQCQSRRSAGVAKIVEQAIVGSIVGRDQLQVVDGL